MQRVAIGRALVREPSIYLMDEPLSSLDAKLRAELRLELKRIQQELGATILYVTHDQIEAMTMATRIGVIRDGQLVQLGTPREIYEHPRRPLRRVAARHAADQPASRRPRFRKCRRRPGPRRSASAPSTCRSRRATAGRLIGRVHRVEHLGDQNHVHLEYKGEMLVTLADPHQPLNAGQDVELQFVASTLFRRGGRRIRAVMQ